MSATELEIAAKAASVEFDEARAAYDEFMAPLEAKRAELWANVRAAGEVKAKNLSKVFEKVTYEDLIDPLTAIVAHELVWNDGHGLEDMHKHVQRILPTGTYILNTTDTYGGFLEDEAGSPVLCFTVSVPAAKDEAKLQLTAEVLAPLYEAAAQISDYARISVMEDHYSEHGVYKIVKEGDAWALYCGHVSRYEDADLVKVLRKVPTHG
jgi:hypothetical protein